MSMTPEKYDLETWKRLSELHARQRDDIEQSLHKALDERDRWKVRAETAETKLAAAELGLKDVPQIAELLRMMGSLEDGLSARCSTIERAIAPLLRSNLDRRIADLEGRFVLRVQELEKRVRLLSKPKQRSR